MQRLMWRLRRLAHPELANRLRVLSNLWYEGETCRECGRRQPLTWWCMDNRLYARLVRPDVGEWPISGEGVGGVVCPRCFDRLARAAGVLLMWQPTEWQEHCRTMRAQSVRPDLWRML
jgi:hypothetical protein